MQDLIPDSVFRSIQRHLVSAGDHAESGWEGGNADEDTLTGDLGAQLRTERRRTITVDGGRWRWAVRYKKFRGRGDHAFESESGADGIVQIEVSEAAKTLILYKGILFQAKKNAIGRDAELINQVAKMEQIAPTGSVVFEYQPNGYRAISGEMYQQNLRNHTRFSRDQLEPLGSFLGNVFLACKSGLRGMYYDGVRELLLIPGVGAQVRAIRLELKHRIAIEVEHS